MLALRASLLLCAAAGALNLVACSDDEGGVDQASANLDTQPWPAATKLEQAGQFAQVVTHIRSTTGYTRPVDWDALLKRGQDQILGGDGARITASKAIFDAFVGVPQGHGGLYFDTCGREMPFVDRVQRGACGRPHSRGIVITVARPGNPLGLAKGDVVTRVGDKRAADIVPALAERPTCTAGRPSAAYRDAVTARSFADLLAFGEEVEIASPDGTVHTARMPAEALSGDWANALACNDPWARPRVAVESSIRPDGIGVVRLPGFSDSEQTWPNPATPEALAAYRTAFEAKIKAAFDAVKTAPAIVWDIRGNGGGMTMVGLGIASGFPGARGGPITYCQARQINSDQFGPRGSIYELTPGGAYAYHGKVAVLIDGFDYSAADYFPLVAKERTDAILVGSQTAGAFGGGTGAEKKFEGPVALTLREDVMNCAHVDGDAPLEGSGTTPDIAVEYDPRDVAAGRDTVLERAVALVR